MIDFSKPQHQLKLCKALHATLLSQNLFAQFETTYLELLGCLQRIWNQTQNAYKKAHRGGDAILNRVYEKRDADELLKYLQHARNAYDHTCEDVTTQTPAVITISSESGEFPTRAIQILNTTDRDHRPQFSAPTSSVRMTFEPARIMPKVFTTRDGTFTPPATHLGNSIIGKPVEELARLAIDYYDGMLRDLNAAANGSA